MYSKGGLESNLSLCTGLRLNVRLENTLVDTAIQVARALRSYAVRLVRRGDVRIRDGPQLLSFLNELKGARITRDDALIDA